MSFSIERAEDGIHFEVKDDTSTEPHDSVWATCDNEMDAFAIATAMNIMDAREEKTTPTSWELLSSVQAEVIGMVEAIVDRLLKIAGNCPIEEGHNCTIDQLREWKGVAEERLNEAIRRSKAK